MRTFSNKFSFPRNNLHSALLLSCALTVLASSAYGTTTLTEGTYSTAITGSEDVEKTGTGTATLTDINTYTGSTTISGGTLIINDNAIPTDSDITLAGGTTLKASEHVVLEPGVSVIFTGAATLDPQGYTFTFNGTINDGGYAITVKGGTGNTLILNGDNTLGRAGIYVGDAAGAATLELEDPQLLIAILSL